MKVHGFLAFPNLYRVRIAVAEKRLTDQVTFIEVDLSGGAQDTPEFLAKNLPGAIPVLELDDGTMISDCTAITEYIDHIYGKPFLTGHNPKERAVVHMMQRRVEAGLMDTVGTYFHHAAPGSGPDIEGYRYAEWGVQQRERVVAGMRYLDCELVTKPYLAGENFTMVDITAFAGLTYADFVSLAIPDECTNLKEWRTRVAARPSIIKIGKMP